ncbi:hypothetical protein D3C79_806230 [compost metagenome]
MPVLLAAKHFGNAAAEVHCDVLEHAAGDRAHARHADPARLFVGRGRQFAVTVVVQLRLPLFGPAGGYPLLHLLDEATVARSEVLGTKIERTGLAAFAGHAPATAVAFVEQVNGLPGLLQGLGSGKAGDTGTDDGNRYCHDGLFEPCCKQTTLSGKPVQYLKFV